MKKNGSTFLEVVIGITIFIIAIIPIAYLTLASLNNLRRSSEIEEQARITTTVINYIKSRGYTNLLISPLSSESFYGRYYLSYDSIEDSYVVVDETTKDITSTSGKDFESDFYSINYNTSSASPDALFLINNLGINLEGATIEVALKRNNISIMEESTPDTYTLSNFINPTTGSTSSIFSGSGGLISDQIIYGLVTLNYSSLDSFSSEEQIKTYEQIFVITPLENF